MRRLLVMFLATCLIMCCTVQGLAEPETMSIRLASDDSSGVGEPVDYPLADDGYGKWIWVTVPEALALDKVSIALIPDEAGTFTLIGETDTHTAPISLDFSNSAELPYSFYIQNAEDGSITWFGWLTVSHDEKPDDLPDGLSDAEGIAPTADAEVKEESETPPNTSAKLLFTPVNQDSVASGYSRVIWDKAPVRAKMSSKSAMQAELAIGSVVYVISQAEDADGNAWYAVQVDGKSGYILSDFVAAMTQAEAKAYVGSIQKKAEQSAPPETETAKLDAETAKPEATVKPTPAPTPTEPPFEQYVTVKRDNVNFRAEAGGGMLYRVHEGMLGRLVKEEPEEVSGHKWYQVQMGEDVGFLRDDMLVFVEPDAETLAGLRAAAPLISVTAAPDLNTQTPAVEAKDAMDETSITELSAPSPQATIPGMQPELPDAVAQQNDMALMETPVVSPKIDALQLAAYARDAQDVVSHCIEDFDGDGLPNLLTMAVSQGADSAYRLQFRLFDVLNGAVVERSGAMYDVDPVLPKDATLQVVLLWQDEQPMIYVAQRSEVEDPAVPFGFGIVLTDHQTWSRITLKDTAVNPVPLLLAASNDTGNLALDDRSGLSEPLETLVDGESVRMLLDTIAALQAEIEKGN